MDLNPNKARNPHKSKVIQYHPKISSKGSMTHLLNQQLELIPQAPFYQSPQLAPKVPKKNTSKKKPKKQSECHTPQLKNSEQKIALNPCKEEHYNKLKFYGKGHIDASRGSLKCPLCQKQLKVYRFNFHKCQQCESYMHLKCYSKLANKESRACCKQSEKKRLKQEKQDKKSQKVFSNMKMIRKKLWKMRSSTIAQQIRSNNFQLNLDQVGKDLPRLYPQLSKYLSGGNSSKVLRFPISDQLFWKYEFLKKYVPTKQLPELKEKPEYFGDLLELWNMYSSIPLYFKKWSHYNFQSFYSKVLGQSFPQMLCPLLILHLQAINSVFSKLMRKQATIDDPNIKNYRNHRFQRLVKTLLFTNRYQQLEVIIKIKRFFLKVVLEILKAHPLCESVKTQIKAEDKTKLQYMCVYDYTISPQPKDRSDLVEKLRQKQIKKITKVLNYDPEKRTQQGAQSLQIEQYPKYYYEEKYESKFQVKSEQDNIKQEEQQLSIKDFFDRTSNKTQLIQLLLVYIHSKLSFRKIVKEYRNAEIEEWKRYKLVYEKYYKNQKERMILDSQLNTKQQTLKGLQKQLKGLKNKQLVVHKTKQSQQLAQNISQKQEKLSCLTHQQSQIQHLLTQYENNYDEKSDAKVYEFQLTHKLKFLGKISPPQVSVQINFWKIQNIPDKIFVSSSRIWGYYPSDKVDSILQCINIRAKSQYKLYRNLLSFKFKGNPGQISDAGGSIEQIETQKEHSEIYKCVDKIQDIYFKDILPLVSVTFKAISQKDYFWISQKQAQKNLKKIEQKIKSARTHSQTLGVFKEMFAILQRYILKNQQIKIWAYQSVKGNWNIRFNYSMSINQKYLLAIIFCLKIDKIETANTSKKSKSLSYYKLEELESNQQENQQQGLYDFKCEDQGSQDHFEFDEKSEGKRLLDAKEEDESPYKKRLTEKQMQKYDYFLEQDKQWLGLQEKKDSKEIQ